MLPSNVLRALSPHAPPSLVVVDERRGLREAVRRELEELGGGVQVARIGGRPVGKRVAWTENEICRLRDGRIAENLSEGPFDAALADVNLRPALRRAALGLSPQA